MRNGTNRQFSALPIALQRAIAEQHPECLPTKERKRQRLYNSLVEVAKAHRSERVEKIARRLDVGRDPIEFFLEGLRLPSVNAMIGSGKKAHQHKAKREARAALFQLDLALHRFENPVDLTILQLRDNRKERWLDAGNLYAKHLIDGLTATHQGLGVLYDDSPRYLRDVCLGNRRHSTYGVLVRIEEVAGDG